jgi:hypothetical protein
MPLNITYPVKDLSNKYVMPVFLYCSKLRYPFDFLQGAGFKTPRPFKILRELI